MQTSTNVEAVPRSCWLHADDKEPQMDQYEALTRDACVKINDFVLVYSSVDWNLGLTVVRMGEKEPDEFKSNRYKREVLASRLADAFIIFAQPLNDSEPWLDSEVQDLPDTLPRWFLFHDWPEKHSKLQETAMQLFKTLIDFLNLCRPSEGGLVLLGWGIRGLSSCKPMNLSVPPKLPDSGEKEHQAVLKEFYSRYRTAHLDGILKLAECVKPHSRENLTSLFLACFRPVRLVSINHGLINDLNDRLMDVRAMLKPRSGLGLVYENGILSRVGIAAEVNLTRSPLGRSLFEFVLACKGAIPDRDDVYSAVYGGKEMSPGALPNVRRDLNRKLENLRIEIDSHSCLKDIGPAKKNTG